MDRLSHVEEIELCKKAQQGCKDAKNKMVTHNLGLVRKIAHKMYFKNPQYSFDDLFQEGILGLLRAIELFDVKEGCRFSTYSYYWIRSFIGRYNENCRGKIRIPSHITDKLRKADPGSEEYKRLKDSIPVVTSLNKLIGENNTLEDIVPTVSINDTDLEISLLTERMMSILNEKEFVVLCHRYGLGGCIQKTHRELGEMFEVSHTAIYLTEKKAINKVKKLLSH